MADVKWIKIVTDIFGNRKIKQIESMPDADSILVIWFKLLCLAGNVNECGLITLTKDIPYTDEMLSTEFRRPLNTVRMALSTFQRLGMIEIVDNILCVSNWEKYQNVEGMEHAREISRKSSAKYREKKQALLSDVTVTSRDGTDIDIERDIDIDNKENIEKKDGSTANADSPSSPLFISLSLKDGSEYPVTESQVEEWKALYPAIDIEQEFRKMKAWCISNTAKRKTKKGISRFINSWLSNAKGYSKKSSNFPDYSHDAPDFLGR